MSHDEKTCVNCMGTGGDRTSEAIPEVSKDPKNTDKHMETIEACPCGPDYQAEECEQHGRSGVEWSNLVFDLRRQIEARDDAILGLLGWTESGSCSDCAMFRAAPSEITFMHEAECGHLESINQALGVLGRPPLVGHLVDDPKAEMRRLAEERQAAVAKRREQEGS